MYPEPVISGMIASKSANFLSSTILPLNKVPKILSYTNGSPGLSSPLAYNVANLAEVPVPHGERSILPSPNTTTFL